MLREFLSGNISLTENISDWEESVKTAAKPLLDKGFISREYVDAMIYEIS